MPGVANNLVQMEKGWACAEASHSNRAGHEVPKSGYRFALGRWCRMSAAVQGMHDAGALLVSVTEQMRGRPALRDAQVLGKLLALGDALRDLASGSTGASKRAQRVLAVEVLGIAVPAARYLERGLPRDIPMRGVGDVLYAVEAVARCVLWAMRRGAVSDEAPRLLAAVAGLQEITCPA